MEHGKGDAKVKLRSCCIPCMNGNSKRNFNDTFNAFNWFDHNNNNNGYNHHKSMRVSLKIDFYMGLLVGLHS